VLQQSKDSVWILVVLPQIVWGRKRQRRYWNKIGHYCFANIFDQKIYLRAALLSRSFSTDLSMSAVWQRSTAPSEDTEDSLLLWFNPKGSSAAQSLTLPRWNEGRESERWRHKNWWVLTVCASKPKQWFNFLHSISRQAVQRLPGKQGIFWGQHSQRPPLPPSLPQLLLLGVHHTMWNIALGSLGQLFFFGPLPASCTPAACLQAGQHEKLKHSWLQVSTAQQQLQLQSYRHYCTKIQRTPLYKLPWRKLTLSQAKPWYLYMFITNRIIAWKILQPYKLPLDCNWENLLTSQYIPPIHLYTTDVWYFEWFNCNKSGFEYMAM